MITHVVVFRWKPEIGPDHIAALAAALDRLAATMPAIRRYRHGPDVGAAAGGNWDYAVVATFDDLDGWRSYDDHAEHERVRATLIRPWAAERAAIQFAS